MKFTWTNHAQFRLHERDFSADQIKLVISNPDFTKHLAGGKLSSKKKLNGKTLEVVYIKKSSRYLIITAYFL